MKVLLLNPPGREVYIRDYYCSKTTKSNYLFHPVDLLALSGTLAEVHELSVLDCIAERLTPEDANARIDAFGPEVIVSMVGSVSWTEDRAFLSGQARLGRRVIAIGDVLHEASERRLAEEGWLEAALHDFSNRDVVHYLDGERDSVQDMTWRDDSGHIRRRQNGARKGTFRLPRPRHELFPEHGYLFSFARQQRFATVLTDYGCPYPCTFCVIGTLGFKERPLEDVLEEIDFLRERGLTEIFFMDQTFGVVRERGLELCRELTERGDLSFTVFTRPDRADGEMFSALAKAGCHTVIMGVESADDEMLAAYKKGYRASEIARAFHCAKDHGLRTVGTFIIGLPEETEESLADTLELAIALDMDFMSLNMAVPRFGTPFRKKAVELGLCSEEDLVMDQGGAQAFLPTSTLERPAMLALKRRMVRRFYLRPRYLWKRLRAVRSLPELKAHAREGWSLVRRNLPLGPARGGIQDPS